MRGEDQLGDFVSMWKENMKMVLNEMSCVGGGGWNGYSGGLL